MVDDDPRSRIPRTDRLLAHPRVRRAEKTVSRHVVGQLIRSAQDRARAGALSPEAVEAEVISALDAFTASSLQPVLNATGVIVHTNLGRAPLSSAAQGAIADAAGYVDVEMDLATGRRSRRGAAAVAALLNACPPAEDALIVNNGAAALLLATTALAGTREVVISRGELVEIGAGFRLPDLIASTGAALHEVGTTNRTHEADYISAIGPETGCVLKVHPSNYRVSGFTSEVSVSQLSRLCRDRGVPLIVDIGSGLLEPDTMLPEEPDFSTALRHGADLVVASGDKLLGGPQAGLLLGGASLITQLAQHPLARAVRTDKLTLAALEATLTGGQTPVSSALHTDPEALRERTARLAQALEAELVPHEGRVGGGGGEGVPLPGWAVRLPQAAASALREGSPPVVARVIDSGCLLDLRCVPESADEMLLAAARHALSELRDDREGGE